LSATAIALRQAEAADLDALMQIETACFSADRISRRSMRRLLARPTARIVIAQIEGRPAGYAMVLVRAGSASARLYSIAVAPHGRGSGAGRRLLEAAEAAALAMGSTRLRLEVREDNEAAIALYRQAGYLQHGRREDYYADGAAALLFARQLAIAGPGRDPVS
jgi:ribosomal protein S18 acetylase RimI-like enzyme